MMIVPQHRFLFLLLLFGMLGVGCKDDFVAAPSSAMPFEGVQQTFANGAMGRAIGSVADDWLPIPGVNAVLAFAYPNPTSGIVSIPLSLAAEDSLRLWLESAPGQLATELYTGRLVSGSHTFQYDFTGHAPGIYRLYMTVYRDGAYTTYGDIMVRP